MRRRITGAVLLLYPRHVRERHGSEIVTLIDDLIAHEGRSRAGLVARLAVDGLIQRMASVATVWSVVAILAASSLGSLAVSDFAAASADQDAPRPAHTSAARVTARRSPPATIRPTVCSPVRSRRPRTQRRPVTYGVTRVSTTELTHGG